MPINRLFQVLNEKEFNVTFTKLELIFIKELINECLESGDLIETDTMNNVKNKIENTLDLDWD